MISLKKILNKILTDLKNTFKKSDTIPISNGGTGATTAAVACSKLGIEDYVVDQGTIGVYPSPVTAPNRSWTYRKWNSGVAECFGYIFLGDSVSVSAVGNVYRGSVSVSLPAIFNDIPSNVHVSMGTPLSSIIGVNGRASDKDNLSVYFWKATKGASSEANVSIYVIGTWK